MKKMILMTVAVLSMALSANVFAAGTPFTGQTIVQTGVGGGAAGKCSILSQDATLNASNNVVAAWGCTAATNLAYGAACHAAGSTNTRNVTCNSCTTAGAATPAGCAGTCTETAPGSGVFNYTPAVANEAVPVTGRVAFAGDTNGGSIGAVALSGAGGTAVCDSATVAGLGLFSTAD